MKLLVGYDGSEQSKRALELAEIQAKALCAKIDVAYAIVRRLSLNYRDIQSTEQRLKREVGKLLDNNRTSYEAHLLVDECSPARQLLDFAKLENVNEIIIGNRKRTKVGKIILGSTAQYIVLNASCPVVTIK